MRGKLARVLRRLSDFKVHDQREYIRLKNSTNYEVWIERFSNQCDRMDELRDTFESVIFTLNGYNY